MKSFKFYLKKFKRRFKPKKEPLKKKYVNVKLTIELIDSSTFNFRYLNVNPKINYTKLFGRFKRWFHTKDGEFYTFKGKCHVQTIRRSQILKYTISLIE